MADEYERILLVRPDVFIYKIPLRTTNRAQRCANNEFMLILNMITLNIQLNACFDYYLV